MIKKLKLDNDNTYPIDVIVLWAIRLKMHYKLIIALAQTNSCLEKALIRH